MGMLEDYKNQEVDRQKEAKKAAEHYLQVDLPGVRTFGYDINAVREHIKEMEKIKALPNHD